MATKTEHKWMSRDEIKALVDKMSAGDLMVASSDDQKLSNAQRAGMAFDSVAAREGVSNGTPATHSVRASDFLYLAELMGEVTAPGNPKADDTQDLLTSAATGA